MTMTRTSWHTVLLILAFISLCWPASSMDCLPMVDLSYPFVGNPDQNLDEEIVNTWSGDVLYCRYECCGTTDSPDCCVPVAEDTSGGGLKTSQLITIIAGGVGGLIIVGVIITIVVIKCKIKKQQERESEVKKINQENGRDELSSAESRTSGWTASPRERRMRAQRQGTQENDEESRKNRKPKRLFMNSKKAPMINGGREELPSIVTDHNIHGIKSGASQQQHLSPSYSTSDRTHSVLQNVPKQQLGLYSLLPNAPLTANHFASSSVARETTTNQEPLPLLNPLRHNRVSHGNTTYTQNLNENTNNLSTSTTTYTTEMAENRRLKPQIQNSDTMVDTPRKPTFNSKTRFMSSRHFMSSVSPDLNDEDDDHRHHKLDLHLHF